MALSEEMEMRIRKQRELSPRKDIKTANRIHERCQSQVDEFLANGGKIQTEFEPKKPYSLKNDWKIKRDSKND